VCSHMCLLQFCVMWARQLHKPTVFSLMCNNGAGLAAEVIMACTEQVHTHLLLPLLPVVLLAVIHIAATQIVFRLFIAHPGLLGTALSSCLQLAAPRLLLLYMSHSTVRLSAPGYQQQGSSSLSSRPAKGAGSDISTPASAAAACQSAQIECVLPLKQVQQQPAAQLAQPPIEPSQGRVWEAQHVPSSPSQTRKEAAAAKAGLHGSGSATAVAEQQSGWPASQAAPPEGLLRASVAQAPSVAEARPKAPQTAPHAPGAARSFMPGPSQQALQALARVQELVRCSGAGKPYKSRLVQQEMVLKLVDQEPGSLGRDVTAAVHSLVAGPGSAWLATHISVRRGCTLLTMDLMACWSATGSVPALQDAAAGAVPVPWDSETLQVWLDKLLAPGTAHRTGDTVHLQVSRAHLTPAAQRAASLPPQGVVPPLPAHQLPCLLQVGSRCMKATLLGDPATWQVAALPPSSLNLAVRAASQRVWRLPGSAAPALTLSLEDQVPSASAQQPMPRSSARELSKVSFSLVLSHSHHLVFYGSNGTDVGCNHQSVARGREGDEVVQVAARGCWGAGLPVELLAAASEFHEEAGNYSSTLQVGLMLSDGLVDKLSMNGRIGRKLARSDSLILKYPSALTALRPKARRGRAVHSGHRLCVQPCTAAAMCPCALQLALPLALAPSPGSLFLELWHGPRQLSSLPLLLLPATRPCSPGHLAPAPCSDRAARSTPAAASPPGLELLELQGIAAGLVECEGLEEGETGGVDQPTSQAAAACPPLPGGLGNVPAARHGVGALLADLGHLLHMAWHADPAPTPAPPAAQAAPTNGLDCASTPAAAPDWGGVVAGVARVARTDPDLAASTLLMAQDLLDWLTEQHLQHAAQLVARAMAVLASARAAGQRAGLEQAEEEQGLVRGLVGQCQQQQHYEGINAHVEQQQQQQQQEEEEDQQQQQEQEDHHQQQQEEEEEEGQHLSTDQPRLLPSSCALALHAHPCPSSAPVTYASLVAANCASPSSSSSPPPAHAILPTPALLRYSLLGFPASQERAYSAWLNRRAAPIAQLWSGTFLAVIFSCGLRSAQQGVLAQEAALYAMMALPYALSGLLAAQGHTWLYEASQVLHAVVRAGLLGASTQGLLLFPSAYTYGYASHMDTWVEVLLHTPAEHVRVPALLLIRGLLAWSAWCMSHFHDPGMAPLARAYRVLTPLVGGLALGTLLDCQRRHRFLKLSHKQ
ncbi:hypothetical protein QJQ45_014450, partial [Haematococcus lacustris]